MAFSRPTYQKKTNFLDPHVQKMAFYRPPNTKKRNFQDPTYIKNAFLRDDSHIQKVAFLRPPHTKNAFSRPKRSKMTIYNFSPHTKNGQKLTPSYKNVKNWSKMAKHVDLHTKMAIAII